MTLLVCSLVDPQWASINFGVFICINCAGIHRSLAGPSASKVRSVRLDSWTPEMIQVSVGPVELAAAAHKNNGDDF